MRTEYKNYFELLSNSLAQVNPHDLEQFEELLFEAYQHNRQIFIFGNGGSAATASHVAGDFVKGASWGLTKKFRFICLNDNMTALMAIANDSSYEDVFVEPLKNFLNSGDLVIGISGSGNSSNVVKALEYAKANSNTTVALSGFKGGKIKELARLSVHVPVMDMEVTEDAHLAIFHTIKQCLIKRLTGTQDQSMGSVYDQRVKQ
jgi:D-sedoheptulose 7-phosphate isomerase